MREKTQEKRNMSCVSSARGWGGGELEFYMCFFWGGGRGGQKQESFFLVLERVARVNWLDYTITQCMTIHI